jgi:hypothetical protein
MNRWIIGLVAAAVIAPLGAFAQPSPEMRAKMEKIFTDAKTSANAALSADHRARVQAITDKVAAGTLDRRAAADQIDAILTPEEKTAVIAVEQNVRAQFRAAMGAPAGAPSPGAAPPGGGPPVAGPPPGAGGPPGGGPPGAGRRTPDAGRFLVMLSRPPRRGGPPEPRASAAP